MGILIILALYSLAILLFVPLESIGKVQTNVRNRVKQLLNRIS